MGTIMVVDDEDDARFVVRQILEKNGHRVVEARAGRECLEKMREEAPDLVLLDIMMPGLDGWEVLGEIQRDERLKAVPVTMFSVKPLTPETLREREMEGLVNYIVKPFSKEGLVKSISQTLDSLEVMNTGRMRLQGLEKAAAEEYDEVSRMLILHKNFLSIFRSVLKQRKADGSMDDIKSFEDVIASESRLIESFSKRKIELERRVSNETGG